VTLDLDCLQSFLVLVEEGQYGHAAARLHISAPTLTKRVQRLEHHLGVRLLERRGPGGLALTPAGKRLAADGGALLSHERAVRQAVSGQPNRVVLGVPYEGGTQSVTATQIGRLRRLLQREQPDAVLVFRRTPLTAMTAWLLEGRVDVQLTPSVVQHGRISSAPVAAVQRVAAVAADSDLGAAANVQLEDFLDQPMLYDPRLPQEFMGPFWLADVRPRALAHLVSIEASDGRAVFDQVRRTANVTVLLASQARGVPPGVRLLAIAGAAPVILHAATRVADRRPVVRSLIDALRLAPIAVT
jgi:DNA-binding transcriptional LysR family regulator